VVSESSQGEGNEGGKNRWNEDLFPLPSLRKEYKGRLIPLHSHPFDPKNPLNLFEILDHLFKVI